MIYKPRAVRKGIKLPFGYFVNPLDPFIALPDKEKLDALHYAYRMKLKYGTSLRDCCIWLHGATGQRMTHNGFFYAYKKWLSQVRKERRKEIENRKKELLRVQQNFIDENFKAFTTVLNDELDISALAQAAAKAEYKKT